MGTPDPEIVRQLMVNNTDYSLVSGRSYTEAIVNIFIQTSEDTRYPIICLKYDE